MNTLTIVGNSEEIITEFTKPLYFTKIALQDFYMEVSWDNICEMYNNNMFKYWNGSEWIALVISDGFYTLTRLNLWIKKMLFDKESPKEEFNDYISPIQIGELEELKKFTIKLKENYKIDLTGGNFHKVLGFEPKVYNDKYQIADYLANIEYKSDDIYVYCDIIDGMQINNNDSSSVIHTFINTNYPGTKIVQKFDKPIFYNVRDPSRGIRRMTMSIKDEDGNLLNLRNRKVKYKFIITDESENYLKKIFFLINK